jgi:hypothetical protein
MIFAISSRHDNQQCIDKIIDFARHHLMTKPCRNVCGAQQLMKLAFSAPLMHVWHFCSKQEANRSLILATCAVLSDVNTLAASLLKY